MGDIQDIIEKRAGVVTHGLCFDHRPKCVAVGCSAVQ